MDTERAEGRAMLSYRYVKAGLRVRSRRKQAGAVAVVLRDSWVCAPRYSILDRFIIQFRLEFLVISHFTNSFHEVFFNHIVSLSSDGKHSSFSAYIP